MSSNSYSYPTQLKKLRACIRCHLVKTEEQFKKEGCDNCRDTLNNEILEKITPHFKGIIAITNPKNSWCAKWMDKGKNKYNFF